MKLPYEEGDWFAVPLRAGGFATGVVARTSGTGGVLLGYFFGPRHPVATVGEGLERASPEGAILVARFGDLSLIRGEWPVLPRLRPWVREAWPMPSFINRDPISGKAWLIEYSDDDPNVLVSMAALDPDEDTDLGEDCVYGAGALQAQLDRLLPRS